MSEPKLRFGGRGENVTIHEPATFIAPEKIYFENHVLVSDFAYIAGGRGIYVGEYVHISAHVAISGGGLCILEAFTGLSVGARLITGSDDYSGKALTNPMVPMKYRRVDRSFIHMKEHSLLATNAVVHPGITIGEGAVAASGSVVTRDLEPWSVYMGVPARKVKDRDRQPMLEYAQALREETPASNLYSKVLDTMRREIQTLIQSS